MTRAALPREFLWGTATAAHQVEGNNVTSDCWALEQARPSLFAEPSGEAVDHLHRFAQDVGIVASLGLNAYRFSIEWARVEPEKGRISQAALDHYQRCIDRCCDLNLAPVVTFHHFTQPLWMARSGGMSSPDFPAHFACYCERAIRALDGIAAVCTLNELNLPILARDYFARRIDAPARAAAEAALGAPLSSFFLFAEETAVLGHGLTAHRTARAAIHAARPAVPVGMTLALAEEAAEPGAEAQCEERRERYYVPFLDAAAADDFVGIQTYTRVTSRADGSVGLPSGAARTSMGYEDRPEAVGAVCRWVASRWRIPMIVTESGYAGEDDSRRSAFIRAAVDGLEAAMPSGADVRGFFYWSLLDNFEWLLGYSQRFGLVSVDRGTQQRTIKPSSQILRSIALARRQTGDAALAPR
jgi:beta-glucosidase